jgi:G:T-mismatch repair DNA endonuclease (very short patch repair protein)
MSDATKAKLRMTTAKAIAEGRIPRVSAFEKAVGETLTQLGVKVSPQHLFRAERGRIGAVVDFFLPDLNVALEANGTFWHADPREYPKGPEHPSQHRTVERYTRKAAFLAQLGIPVVEVWELDFRANPEQTVRNALHL